MNNEMLDFLMEDIQFVDIMTADILDEGATIDTWKTVMRSNMTQIKQAYKDANTLYRQGDKTKALAKVKECKTGFENVKKELNKIPDTTMSTVCSFLVHGGLINMFFTIKAGGSKGAAEWGKSYLLQLVGSNLLSIISPGAAIAGSMMGSSVKLALNREKGIDTDNVVKSDIIKAIDENIKMCDKLAEAIKRDK